MQEHVALFCSECKRVAILNIFPPFLCRSKLFLSECIEQQPSKNTMLPCHSSVTRRNILLHFGCLCNLQPLSFHAEKLNFICIMLRDTRCRYNTQFYRKNPLISSMVDCLGDRMFSSPQSNSKAMRNATVESCGLSCTTCSTLRLPNLSNGVPWDSSLLEYSHCSKEFNP